MHMCLLLDFLIDGGTYKMESKEILVTGEAGFVGTKFVNEL